LQSTSTSLRRWRGDSLAIGLLPSPAAIANVLFDKLFAFYVCVQAFVTNDF